MIRRISIIKVLLIIIFLIIWPVVTFVMEISIPIKYEIIDFIGAEKTREETTVDVVKKYKEIETTLLFSKKEHYYIVYKEDPYSRGTQEVDANVYNNTKIGKIVAEKTIYKLRDGTTTTMVRVKELGNIIRFSFILIR